MSASQKETLSDLLHMSLAYDFHHGDCVGADAEAHEIALSRSYTVIVHPPIDDRLRAHCKAHDIREPKEYLARNRDIVDEVDFLVAAPNGEEKARSGTWYTIRYAMSEGVPVVILPWSK